MKAIGIVRRIDDLGRVVIPREIRRNMGIKEGDPLEIFIGENKTLCLRKYNFNFSEDLQQLRESIVNGFPYTNFCCKEIEEQFEILIGLVKKYESEEE